MSEGQHDESPPVLSAAQLGLLREIHTKSHVRDWPFTPDLSGLASLRCIRLTDAGNGMHHVDILPLGRRMLAEADTATKCPTRRRYEAANSIAPGISPMEDIGPCDWTGMTEEEKADAMSEGGGSCANPAHRYRLQRMVGMPDE